MLVIKQSNCSISYSMYARISRSAATLLILDSKIAHFKHLTTCNLQHDELIDDRQRHITTTVTGGILHRYLST